MRCACNRWGPGTTVEKPIHTAASKELQEKLAAMHSERMAQDKMWDTEPEKPMLQYSKPTSSHETKK
jgi:hypothetical protein